MMMGTDDWEGLFWNEIEKKRLIPLGSKRKSIVSVMIIIFAVLLCLDGYMIRPAWGEESVVFSIDVTNEKLGNVLRTIGKQTGFKFLISELVKNMPVSVSLSKVPLEEGLNRIMRVADIGSHSIIFDGGKTIYIRSFDNSSLASYAGQKPIDSPSNSSLSKRVSYERQPQNEEVNRLIQDVGPPEMPGAKGDNTRKLHARASRSNSIQPLKVDDVVLPEIPGEN